MPRSAPINWVMVGALVAFVALNTVLKKSIFAGGEQDGFYAQIASVYAYTQGLAVWETPVQAIHVVRMAVVYPYLFVYLAKLPAWIETVLLIPYILPILRARFGGKSHPVQYLCLLLPYALSMRAALLAYGFCLLYLYLFSDRRSPWQLVFSLLLAFLSSGVVLSWAIIAVLCSRQVLSGNKVGVPLMGVGLVGLGVSLADKLTFFDSQAAGTSGKGLASALERSTVVDALNRGDIAKFGVYLALISVGAWYLWQLFTAPRIPRTLLYFFAASIPGFAMEGLAAMAYILPFAFAICGLYVLEGPQTAPQVQSA